MRSIEFSPGHLYGGIECIGSTTQTRFRFEFEQVWTSSLYVSLIEFNPSLLYQGMIESISSTTSQKPFRYVNVHPWILESNTPLRSSGQVLRSAGTSEKDYSKNQSHLPTCAIVRTVFRLRYVRTKAPMLDVVAYSTFWRLKSKTFHHQLSRLSPGNGTHERSSNVVHL